MNRVLTNEGTVRFRNDLYIQNHHGNKAILKTRYRQITIESELGIDLLRTIGETHSLKEIVSRLSGKYSETQIYGLLNLWWDKGLFEDIGGLVSFR